MLKKELDCLVNTNKFGPAAGAIVGMVYISACVTIIKRMRLYHVKRKGLAR